MPPSDVVERPNTAARPLCSAELQHAVEQYYYFEAELLDDRRFEDWLTLLAADIHYWMPVRSTVQRRDIASEVEDERGAAYFDDVKPVLEMRVRKLLQPSAWAEDPPSRTRHSITNVRIAERDDGLLDVRSHFIVYQNRSERRTDLFVGEREDVLRPVEGPLGFEIARRRILLDQATLNAPMLTSFF